MADHSFEAFLLDEVGDNDPEPFTDPVMWAKGFIDLWQHARDRMTLVENNEQALEDARRFPIVDQLLSVMDQKDLEPAAVLLKAGRGGKIDWRAYQSEFRSVLFGWRGDLTAWLEVQRTNMQEAPQAIRLMLVRMVRERGDQLKAGMPDWVIALIETKAPVDSTPPKRLHLAAVNDKDDETKPIDPDEVWVDTLIRDVNDLTNIEAIDAYAKRADVQREMKRLSTANRQQYTRADSAFTMRLADINYQGDDPNPPEAA
jgi:hypothetical protein